MDRVEAGATCDKRGIGEDERSERCDSADVHWIRRQSEIKMSSFSLGSTGMDRNRRTSEGWNMSDVFDEGMYVRRPLSLELARRRFMKVVTEVKSGGVVDG